MQNEEISIRINVDDRAIWTLDRTIQELNRTLSTMVSNIEESYTNLQILSREMDGTSSVTKDSEKSFDAFGFAMKLVKTDADKLATNLSSLTRHVFPELSDALKGVTKKNGGGGGIGDLIGAFSNVITGAANVGGAIGSKSLLAGALQFITGPIGLTAGALFFGGRALFRALNQTEDAAEYFGIGLRTCVQ